MAEIEIDADYPGGNIVIERIDGDVIDLRQDRRDTKRWWFYWNFRVGGAAGRALKFRFTDGDVIGTREKGVKLMLHSFYNARDKEKNCLDVLNIHQVPTRCADNLMWAVANNSSHPYSHWGSFVARPDATIPKQLPKNKPGILIHDFPDGLSDGGWLHNHMPMKLAKGERLYFGTTSGHIRQQNGQSEP